MAVKTTRHEITDDAIITRSGIVTKQHDTVELYRVKNVRATDNAFAGGKVIVTSGDGSEHVMKYVADPGSVVSTIRQKVAAARDSKNASYREHL